MEVRRKNVATTTSSSSSSSSDGSGGSDFQMPLHYPRYTKEEYKELPEWMLDRLLAQYGLSAKGHPDLESKREFAMGAFLWPPQPNSKPTNFHDQLAYRLTLHGKICSASPTIWSWSFLRKKKV